MGLQKIWIGGATDDTGNWNNAENWEPVSIRSDAYQWTASSSGTGEFYLELASGGDPSLTEPASVLEAGGALEAGTAGSLAAGEWDFADNDTLGFSTVYVRLADDADPDSKSVGYVTLQQVPVAGDDVTLPSSAGYAITDGLDQSSVALNSFNVRSFSQAVGTAGSPLRISTGAFSWDGSVRSWIDLTDSAINPQVSNTARVQPNEDQPGLLLTGTALGTVSVQGGTVGIAWRTGETSTVNTVRTVGQQAALWLGPGVSVTNVQVTSGKIIQRCASTATTINGGEFESVGSGAIGTLTVNGGKVLPNSTGTITTLVLGGGETDFTTSGLSRTASSVKLNPGAKLNYDPSVLTVTAWASPDRPVKLECKA